VEFPAPVVRRYWWVNQNQTFRQEQEGGYLWSPKRKANDARNRFYEYMREVAPGDLVFSFRDTRIPALGVATDFCFEAPKPADFGTTGTYWNRIGWKVPVQWTRLPNRIRPSDHMAELAPLLPTKYAPLRTNGHGGQRHRTRGSAGALATGGIRLRSLALRRGRRPRVRACGE